MKNTLPRLFAPAALVLAGLATPALAGSEPIVVQSEAAMEAWTAEVTKDLERQLYLAQHKPGYLPKNGIVQLRFTLNDKGKAHNFEYMQKTGNMLTDRLARDAVRRLQDLDEAPVRNARDQTFVANIIFAESREQRDEFAKQLAKSERERLAANGGERTYIAIAL